MFARFRIAQFETRATKVLGDIVNTLRTQDLLTERTFKDPYFIGFTVGLAILILRMSKADKHKLVEPLARVLRHVVGPGGDAMPAAFIELYADRGAADFHRGKDDADHFMCALIGRPDLTYPVMKKATELVPAPGRQMQSVFPEDPVDLNSTLLSNFLNLTIVVRALALR